MCAIQKRRSSYVIKLKKGFQMRAMEKFNERIYFFQLERGKSMKLKGKPQIDELV